MDKLVKQSETMQEIASRARRAALQAALMPGDLKTKILNAFLSDLHEHRDLILQVNAEDVELAREAGCQEPHLNLLRMTNESLQSIIQRIRLLNEAPDPIGEVIEGWRQSDGLSVQKVRIPLGVMGVLFHDRPYLVADAAALSVKSGNAAILWSGRYGFGTSLMLSRVLNNAMDNAGAPAHQMQFLESQDPDLAEQMMQMYHLVDAIIPKGNDAWVQFVSENSLVPVISTGYQRCVVYAHEDVTQPMMNSLLLEQTLSRICQQMMSCALLIHENLAPEWVPKIHQFCLEQNVPLRPCDRTREWLTRDLRSDYEGDLCPGVYLTTVSDLNRAIDWIHQSGHRHSDMIMTQSLSVSQRFTREVDSAFVYVNASPLSAHNGDLGQGCHIGVGTHKLHARGPLGLRELTTYKYVLQGEV